MHKTQLQILKFLNRKPNATYADIAKHLKTNLSGIIVHHVEQLMKGEFLKRNPRWAVSNKAKLILKETK